MKHLKRLLAVMLALTLGLALLVPAFATEELDEPGGEEEPGSSEIGWAWLAVITIPLGLIATPIFIWIIPFVPILRLVFLFMPMIALLPFFMGILIPTVIL